MSTDLAQTGLPKSLRYCAQLGLVVGLIVFLTGVSEVMAQAHRIQSAAPGVLEAGAPLFTIRSQDALGLESAPTDMRLMPDGRLLVFGGRQVALGDGTRWEVFRQAKGDLPVIGTSVLIDKEGKIYVGVPGDFARIDLNGLGEWRGHLMYVWPMEKRSSVPISLQSIEADGEWFWHSGSGPLTKWKPGQEPSVMGYANTSEHVFRFKDGYYLSDQTSGQLWHLGEHSLEPVAYADSITPRKTITCSTSYDSRLMLVGTYAEGLKFFDGNHLLPFKGRSILTDAIRINSLCKTEKGYFAAAVENVGIVFFNDEGTVVQVLDRSIDSRLWRVKRLLPAAGGIIWGLLDDGIVRVEFPSRLSYFEKFIGMGLATAQVYRFEGKLWLMVDGRILRGVYDNQQRLVRFDVDSPKDCFAYTFSCALGMPVTGTEIGAFYWNEKGWHSFARSTVNLCILNPKPINGRWLYAAKGEIGWLKPSQDGFEVESHSFPELDNVYNTEVDINGSVWLELGNASVGRVKIVKGDLRLEKFGLSDGLLDGWVQVFFLDGKVGFNVSNQMILSFNEAAKHFELDRDFMRKVPDLSTIEGRPAIDSKGRLWISADGSVQVFNQRGNVLVHSGESMISGFMPYFFTFEDKGVVWMHKQRHLVRYDPGMPANPAAPLRALVSSVSLPSSRRTLMPNDKDLMALPYSDNSLVIHYVALGGSLSASTAFDVMLEGSSKDWDSVGSAGSTAFNRLKEGNYVLHLRPKSTGVTGTEATLAFRILPPWYRTVWAYFLYFAATAAALYSLIKTASVLQRREQLRLEKLVNQRTRELNETNAFLATQIEEVRRLSQAVEQSPVGIVLTRPDSTIVYANPCFCSMYGYSLEELKDISLKNLRANTVSQAVRDEVSATITSGESWHGTLSNRHKDGHTVQTRCTLSPIRSPDGTIRSLLILEEDITEWLADQERQRRLEAQLFQSRKMKSLGTLAGGIAHDFNNILTGILGYCELATLTPGLPHDVTEALMEIRSGGLRARDLVSQILTFSRKSFVKLEPIDLSRAVADALKLIRATTPSTIEIITKLESGIIRANLTQIHQIMVNLCTNAVHAMASKPGRLEISVQQVVINQEQIAELHSLRAGTFMMLTVADNGQGMDQATLDRVFDPFFTTKRPGEGTGLGLAIVQGIVSSHNGELRVQSTVGVGTSFSLYFPVCSDPLPTPQPATETIPLGRAEEILVVDDEPSIGAIVGTRLKQLNYRPIVFLDPAEALKVFHAAPSQIKAVITDLTMPSMTGVDLVQAIRKTTSTIPVIVMTGYSQDSVRSQLDVMPNCVVLQKPVDCDVIACTLGELLKTSRDASNKPV